MKGRVTDNCWQDKEVENDPETVASSKFIDRLVMNFYFSLSQNY